MLNNFTEKNLRRQIDFALHEFQRSLFYSGYHEKWETRGRLTQIILRAKLKPEDAGWVYLKSDAYMQMELGNYLLAKAAIEKAFELFKSSNYSKGIGECFLYYGELQSKFGNVADALSSMVEAVNHLKGTPALEAQLGIKLVELQHLTEPSDKKIKELIELGERFNEIKSWRYWLTEIERAKTLALLGECDDAITIANFIEFTFRSGIKMERTRKIVARLIEDLKVKRGRRS